MDCIVIGGGPAGLTAGIYLSRFNLKNIIFARDYGMASETSEIENYPGFVKISGTELIGKFTEQAKHFGSEIIYDEIQGIEKQGNGFIVKTATNKEYSAKTLILAMGTHKRKLNVPGEKEFTGKGVSYCATCDGAFFKNVKVGVSGGGNSALTTAILLASYGNEVHLFARTELSAHDVLIERINANDKIIVHKNTEVTEIMGDTKMQKVKIKTNNDLEEMELNGLFVEIGLVPNTKFVENFVELEKGMIKVNTNFETNVPGVFAAGDITTGSKMMWQIVTASAEGAIAADSVYKYLSKE